MTPWTLEGGGGGGDVGAGANRRGDPIILYHGAGSELVVLRNNMQEANGN